MLLDELIAKSPLTDNVKVLPRAENESISVTPKPFLQWVGGKREFINRYPAVKNVNFSTYYEPFLGGGAMMFALNPDEAVLGDMNGDLMNTFSVVRDSVEELITLLSSLQARHSKDFYMSVRALDRNDSWETEKTVNKAARFIYLNKTGFNGVYRVNRKGQYNVPIGSSLNKLICDSPTLRSASKFFQNKVFLHSDFQALVEPAKDGDFVYFDPPYVPLGGYSDFTRYTKEQFDLGDQVRLQETIKSLDSRGVKVMMSNSNTEIVRELYKDFFLTEVNSSRNLNSKAASRKDVTELVVTNYDINLGAI